jgi:nucleotide-binding universal stress UspA family protein
MFKNILVPLDGTPECNVALPVARTLARISASTITLFRACGDGEPIEHVQAKLGRIAEELGSDDVRARAVVECGDPTGKILAQVGVENADLIVMRTHGRSGLGRLVLGSVTQRVLSASQVPVVLVRPGGRRMDHMRNVLVPVDGSPGSAFALGTAVQLAGPSGAALHLLEVVVPTSTYAFAGSAWADPAYMDPTWDDEALAGAKTYVDGICARLQGQLPSVSGEAVLGSSVPETIVERATKQSADLIVMSSHTLTGVARAILGSVADAVVRTADCPVLVLHAVERSPGLDVEVDDPVAVAGIA